MHRCSYLGQYESATTAAANTAFRLTDILQISLGQLVLWNMVLTAQHDASTEYSLVMCLSHANIVKMAKL